MSKASDLRSKVFSTGDIKRFTGFTRDQLGSMFVRGLLPVETADRLPTGSTRLLTFSDMVDAKIIWELSQYMRPIDARKALGGLHAYLGSLGLDYLGILESGSKQVAFVYPSEKGFKVFGESDKTKRAGVYLQLSLIISEVSAAV